MFVIWGARTPAAGTPQFEEAKAANLTSFFEPASVPGRTAGGQAGFQAAAIAVTLVFAIVGGLFTGYVLSLRYNFNKENTNTKI